MAGAKGTMNMLGASSLNLMTGVMLPILIFLEVIESISNSIACQQIATTTSNERMPITPMALARKYE